MTIKEFIKYVAPRRCGVNPAFGEIGWMAVEAERKGNIAFTRDNFSTTRERCKIAFPYPHVKDRDQYERCLDIAELGALGDDERRHKKDNSKRIRVLEKRNVYTTEEREIIEAAKGEYWNG